MLVWYQSIGGYFIYKATTKGGDGAMPGDVANTIQALMNATLDPCDDYYEYACGTWRSKESTHTGRSPYVRSFNILVCCSRYSLPIYQWLNNR